MSARGLQTLLFTSLTDGHHESALLHGSASACDGFELTPREVKTLMAIQAGRLEDFARSAHALFYGEELPMAGLTSSEMTALLAERDVA